MAARANNMSKNMVFELLVSFGIQMVKIILMVTVVSNNLNILIEWM
jgi:hypothetical protein